MWHHKMEITECEDSSSTDTTFCGGKLSFPSNSSYPPGLVCAKDVQRTCIFSEGDSGSPLMVIDKTRPDRFIIEGVLSFIKGCDGASYGNIRYNDLDVVQLNLKTENPSAYTKLSCFLPWIAEQYDMDYNGSPAPECLRGTGGSVEEEKPKCKSLPTNLVEVENGEKDCIFPFYFAGDLYNECNIHENFGYIYPEFRCPTREIVSKINGINSYPNRPVGPGFCPVDPNNSSSPLDPDKQDCPLASRRPVSSVCKNDCPGGLSSDSLCYEIS